MSYSCKQNKNTKTRAQQACLASSASSMQKPRAPLRAQPLAPPERQEQLSNKPWGITGIVGPVPFHTVTPQMTTGMKGADGPQTPGQRESSQQMSICEWVPGGHRDVPEPRLSRRHRQRQRTDTQGDGTESAREGSEREPRSAQPCGVLKPPCAPTCPWKSVSPALSPGTLPPMR